MKTYTVTVNAIYTDTLDADSADEAKQLAHERAEYDFECIYDIEINNMSDEHES